MSLEILVPLKVTAREGKVIVGPYRRVTKHYYLALGFMAPDELSVRWELHLLVDTNGVLGRDEGVATIAGPKTLARYRGDWRRMRVEAASRGLKGRLYIPPWGIPMILPERSGPVEEPIMTLMSFFGLERARDLLRDLASRATIIEV